MDNCTHTTWIEHYLKVFHDSDDIAAEQTKLSRDGFEVFDPELQGDDPAMQRWVLKAEKRHCSCEPTASERRSRRRAVPIDPA